MTKNIEKKVKVLKGEVVSDAMDKTVVVNISRVKTHVLYHKKFTLNKRYKAHDENNEYKVGDIIEISPCKPISKDKKYIVIKKIS